MLSRSGMGDFILREVRSENVKSETTKLPAGVRNIKPLQTFLSVASW